MMGACWRCNGSGSYYPTCAFERFEETGHSCPSCPDIRLCDACDATGSSATQEQAPDALTAARAEGYAECQADVVAWLRARGRLVDAPPKTDARRALAASIFMMAGQIYDGAHVGAAKKGGE